MVKSWSSEKPVNMQYNNWLRDTAEESRNMLHESTGKLLAQLSVLDSVICQERISSRLLTRVLVAESHLMTELHLLVISTVPKEETE